MFHEVDDSSRNVYNSDQWYAFCTHIQNSEFEFEFEKKNSYFEISYFSSIDFLRFSIKSTVFSGKRRNFHFSQLTEEHPRLLIIENRKNSIVLN
jgi:hypothetical protein